MTALIGRWNDGDPDAMREVVSLAYTELRQIASGYLHAERCGHTLQPTALIHEVYVRLVGEPLPPIVSRSHFLGLSARLMRQILVNHARSRGAQKRGGGWERVPLERALADAESQGVDVLAIDEALRRLAARDVTLARVVELRFFGGLTVPETAEAMGVSSRKVVESWAFARAWLRKELAA